MTNPIPSGEWAFSTIARHDATRAQRLEQAIEYDQITEALSSTLKRAITAGDYWLGVDHYRGCTRVFDRIDMNIVDMPREIDFVTYGMLPISALPDAPFTFGRAALGYPLIARQTARKGGFDQLPAHCKIGITFW